MKKYDYCRRAVVSAVFSLCILSGLSAKSPNDTCGIKIIENALKTAQISANESPQLNAFRKWLIEFENPCSSIVTGLEERIKFLSDTTRFIIDTSGLTFSGDSAAPVEIVMYVSLTCPLCKRLYSELFDSVTAGNLKSKAKLAVKPFGINIFNCAMVTASHWGKQSELLRAVAPIKERLSLEMVLQAVDSLKIPIESFQFRMENQSTLEYVRKSHEEASQNGVKITPTIFINSHRYKSYKDSRWVTDAAEILYRRLSEKH